jgi:hypothetical protein
VMGAGGSSAGGVAAVLDSSPGPACLPSSCHCRSVVGVSGVPRELAPCCAVFVVGYPAECGCISPIVSPPSCVGGFSK